MDDAMENAENEAKLRKWASILAKVTFGVNLVGCVNFCFPYNMCCPDREFSYSDFN